ncbi:hypothetical protein CH296_01180 [Rhodococcus sp. 14-2496-1d]|nr:hypothetical protein CH296_01180 [Rhodococcus sp. 14-2496-1d]
MHLTWNIGKRFNKPGQTRREYSLTLNDKYGSSHFTKGFTVTALRQLCDALQDAVDGNYGSTHEWFSTPCRRYRKQVIVEKGRTKISAEPSELARLIEEIDYLLGDI